MRLSADLINQAEQRTNPLGERELILRGYSIPMIENLGVTRDAYDSLDLSDNRLTTVGNFPKLARLSSLLLSNNRVERIDGMNLQGNLPNLTTLILSNNHITGLHEVENISVGCKKLEFLCLFGNPVVRRQHYRLYIINKIPTLKVLDFQKVKQSEREKASRLAQSSVGATLEGDVRAEARLAAKASVASTFTAEEDESKTFEPGQGRTTQEAFVINFTPDQKAKIREMIEAAKQPEEIERIERMVQRGIFPGTVPSSSDPPSDGGSLQ